MKNKIPCAIFDLDGCLFDDEWRLKLINHDLPVDQRYEVYHEGLSHDSVIPQSEIILGQEIKLGNKILFITARPLKYSIETRKQLEKHFGLADSDYVLYMRPDNDHRPSVELKRHIVQTLLCGGEVKINAAYDDRMDICVMYQQLGIDARILKRLQMKAPTPELLKAVSKAPATPSKDESARTAADILTTAGDTFRERNRVYGDNAHKVGDVMEVLFPNGVHLKTKADHHIYHLFELIIVKLTRFTNSGLTHQDSIHDLMVYAAMVENLVEKHNIQFGEKA